jgi:hypothetical protein
MESMKKVGVSLIVIATAILFGVLFFLKGDGLSISLTRGQIQSAINAHMPYEKKMAFIFTLTLKNTEVLLKNGSDRIGVLTHVEMSVRLGDKSEGRSGSIQAMTGIRYDPETFRFYLQKPQVEDILIEDVPSKYTDMVEKAGREILETFLDEIHVYTIDDKDMKMKLARAVLKDVNIVNGSLRITLGVND